MGGQEHVLGKAVGRTSSQSLFWGLRGTIRGDPQKTLYHVWSPTLIVRLVKLLCNHNEAERSV